MPVGPETDHTGSDYGSDFDDAEAEELRTLLEAIEFSNVDNPLPEKEEGDERPPVAKVPAASSPRHSQRPLHTDATALSHPLPPAAAPRELDIRLLGSPHSLPHEESPGRFQWETEEPNPHAQDSRSPLERFRKQPKKPLSVTDLVSPAWCELQYWYHLINYGRVKPTVAMQRGSEVHKILEEQVHQTVPVDVQTKEDTWGLRIWNVIQGLRTLRATGITRELELWGVVDGQVINGIIDELSLDCTDPELEASIEKYEKTGQNQPQLPADQTTISQFFASQGGTTLEGRLGGSNLASSSATQRRIYLTDVKTRGSPFLPKPVAMRPTFMQLMLYRRLLADMACNRVDPTVMFGRYNLDPTVRLSDALIAQLSALDSTQDSDVLRNTDGSDEPNTDVVMELLSHNSLNDLWALMVDEFRLTIPQGEESISKVLKVEYRSSKDGSIVGVKTFPYRAEDIEAYVAEEMRWWKGEREAKGVDIEEAFKCKWCEFADGCTWRINKIGDAVAASRARQAKPKKDKSPE